MAIQRVEIVYRDHHPQAAELAQTLIRDIERLGVAARAESATTWQSPGMNEAESLIIVLGGDGTILATARQCARHGTPILGVNFGHVGFLTELQPDEVAAQLPYYLRGECWVDERMMLNASISGVTDGTPIPALNDIVVVRGDQPRIIRLRVWINNEFYSSFTADGVIVATATGSTAYNLAAGGPILHPTVRGSVLTAIAPHLAVDRPLVLDPDATVRLELTEVTGAAIISADGQITMDLPSGASVTITRSPHTTRFLRRRSQNHFFRILSEKLSGNSEHGGV